MIQIFMLVGCLLISAFDLAGSGSYPINDQAVRKVEIQRAGFIGKHVFVEIRPILEIRKNARIVVAHGVDPIGWFEQASTGEGDSARYISLLPIAQGLSEKELAELDVWVIDPTILASLRESWPSEVALHARIDDLVIGGDSVWIDAGRSQGISSRDVWWRRVAGQPVARFDVRYVGPEMCLCRVISLVSDNQEVPGQTVELWPSPGLSRLGRSVSAVSFVEQLQGQQVAWVPSPPKLEAPTPPRVDFYRGKVYVGSGIAERSDGRFCHVRILSGASAKPVAVGDWAIFRTNADIRNKRVTARVFELTGSGGLINAGEIDGLSGGAVGTVYRGCKTIGTVLLRRVQRGYSEVEFSAKQPATGSSEPAIIEGETSNQKDCVLKKLDMVRFCEPLPSPPGLGELETIVCGTLFTARIGPSACPPVLSPIVIKREGSVIGMALLLEIEGDRAVGFFPERTWSMKPRIGDQLSN